MVTWYNPAESVVSTVLTTSAATPPTVTVGEIVLSQGDPLTTVPAGTGGLVAPKPSPTGMQGSPGLAGTVPATAAGSAMAA